MKRIIVGFLLTVVSVGVTQSDSAQNAGQQNEKVPVFTNESLKPYLDNLPKQENKKPVPVFTNESLKPYLENLPTAQSPTTSAQPVNNPQVIIEPLPSNMPKVESVDSLLAKAGLDKDEVSIVLMNSAGKMVYSLNPDVPRSPASVIKAITTGVALEFLGADYRWKTEFFAVGRIDGDVLDGHLAVKGYGNPYFVEEKLDDAIQQIRQQQGLREIAGDLLLDGSYFAGGVERPGLFDGQGTEPYNAVPNALSINFRTAEIIYTPTSSGVQITTRPPLMYTRFQNNLDTNNGRCQFNPSLSVKPNSDVVRVDGVISQKCGAKRHSKVIADAGDLLAGHIKRSWREAGGEFNGDWYYDRIQPSYQLIHTAMSRPLSEQVKAMNQFSNNIMTRQLFLTLGAEYLGAPATEHKGREAVMKFLNNYGIDTESVFIENGSGLSRESILSAKQISTFLFYMAKSPSAMAYKDSLSVAGLNGTMKSRLQNTPLANNFRGKTGTLNDVKALAGYFTSSQGETMTFAMMINAAKANKMSKTIDNVLLNFYQNY